MGKLEVSEIKVLKNLAKYDPELAKELATSGEPIEEKIANEVIFARLVKYSKLKDIDLETLLVTFDFWNEMMKRAIQYISSCNAFFMMNFLDQYTHIAQAVMERMKIESPDAKTMLVMKGLEILDDFKKQMQQPYLSFYSGGGVVEKEEKTKSRKRRKRKKTKVKVK